MSASQAPFLPIEIRPGKPYPLGATVLRGDDGSTGVNFSIFSAHATAVDLLLFDHYDDEHPRQIIPLDPARNKTYYYWHVYIHGLGDGQIYGYRVQGPFLPEEGLRFNGNKVLLDPYTRAVAYSANWSRVEALGLSDNTHSALKSVVVDTNRYDWHGDQPLQRPMNETIIYETHIRSLTAHPSAALRCPGTYRGLIDKIPYLQSLGVTAVELLPIQQYDPQEVSRLNPITLEPLKNYWGYAPLAYFAPHLAYGCQGDARATVNEFRDMVRALHQAGIEVILDVVFNHTGEAGDRGPTISFRGLENGAYYMLQPDRRFYKDFSGCGNTVSGNHSIVRRLIVDCLRYWVQEYHIDGFRFDLASVLSRGEDGEPLGPGESPILWEIESEPALAGTKLIAEAWDAAGLYELGSFTGDRWAEWNGRFRDDVRRFVRGDPGMTRDLAWRLTGSFDVFRHKPSYVSHRSINYVTCHDGFTLADLVSYNTKHNEANGEENRDGSSENFSWNCGVEGPTNDARVLALRRRQAKNLLALLMVARGTPMVLGGDEMGRTQNGNNNAYCQDNEISWFDWSMVQQNADLWRFIQGMIALRTRHPTLTVDHVLRAKHYEDLLSEGVTFHGVAQNQPDWGHESRALAMELHPAAGDRAFYVIANAHHETRRFDLPPQQSWKRIVDTSQDSPADLVAEDLAPLWQYASCDVAPYSVVILLSTS